MSEVVISGLGAVCAAGSCPSDLLRAFGADRRPPGPPARLDSPPAGPVFAVDRDFPPTADRTQELTRLALDQALAEARWSALPPDTRVGVCLGTTVACQLNDFAFYGAYRATRDAPIAPALRFLKSSLADVVGRWLGRPGPRLTIANA